MVIARSTCARDRPASSLRRRPAYFGPLARRVGARHADFEREPLIERIDRPVAAVRDARSRVRQECRGFHVLVACRPHVVARVLHGIGRRLFPLKRQHRNHVQLLVAAEVLADRRSRRARWRHGCPCPGKRARSASMPSSPSCTARSPSACMCGSKPAPAAAMTSARSTGAGKYTSGPRFLPGAQRRLAPDPCRLEIRLEHRARQRGRRDHSVEKQLHVAHRERGQRCARRPRS